MARINDAHDGFQRAIRETKILFGFEESLEAPFLFYSQLGFYGYSVSVCGSHREFLVDLNSFLVSNGLVFDDETIERWRLVNDLLVEGLQRTGAAKSRISKNATMLACLAAFPTLEEIARRISEKWQEDGTLVQSEKLRTWKPDGTFQTKDYKAGQRIVLLAHKLQLMHSALDPRLAELISGLDQSLQKSQIDGLNQPTGPLYEKLQYFRDHWLHGRRFDGWEALLVSLLLSLIYFGSALAQKELKPNSSAK